MTQNEVNRSYREAQIRGANSVECTILLYDVVIADLRRALDCLTANDIEGRSLAIAHSINALGYLQGTLQMESGGEAAQHLYRFYSLARAKILEGQIKCRAQLLQEIIDSMQQVRSLWVKVKESCAVPPAEPWMSVSEQSTRIGAWSA